MACNYANIKGINASGLVTGIGNVLTVNSSSTSPWKRC
jgi:hypothetical protein